MHVRPVAPRGSAPTHHARRFHVRATVRHTKRLRPATLSAPGSGVVLPDPRVTPGAVNPRVRQSTIATTICVPGWTSTIRPDSSYTTSVKIRQLRSGYNLRGDTATGDYEEDHLISLELGGSPRSVRNLWPEPYRSREGARVKDEVENKLRDLVCAGRVGLRVAQRAIATNWWHAYRHFMPIPVRARRAPPKAPAPKRTDQPRIRQSCTTTASGSCIRGGEFCPAASYGRTGYDASGDRYVCAGDPAHPHWQT